MLIKDLNTAENQIQNLLSTNEADWKEAAKIAIAVQDKKLYEQRGYNSFTAWVTHIANLCDRQPSLIWRHIKASRYYLQLQGSNELEKINEIKAAPEALELLEKISRTAPQPVFEKLRDLVLNGDCTIRECRQIEKDYRPAQNLTNRGRPAKGQEGKYTHLGSWKKGAKTIGIAETAETAETKTIDIAETAETAENYADSDRPLSSQKFSKIPRGQIATTIARSLSINLVDWTNKCGDMKYPPRNFKEHTEVRINVGGKRRRIDFLAVVRWSMKRPKEIFAIEIKSCLEDFSTDNKWTDYLDFCHYFCFAIPNNDSALRDAILIADLAASAGILSVDFNSEIRDDLSYPVYVIRTPQKLFGNLAARTYETLYERALGWSGSDKDKEEDEDEDEDE